MSLSIFSSKEAKKFGRGLLLFLVMVIGLLIIVSVVVKNTVIKTVCDSSHFKLPEDVKTLIVGNSYLMTGLIPEILPNAVNGAKRAEILPFTYEKIKFICDNNPQIKNVIISLSYFSFTKEREHTLREKQSVQYYCDSYFSLYDQRLKEITRVPISAYFIAWSKYTLGIPFEISKELGRYLKIVMGIQEYYTYPFWGGFQVIPQREKDLHLAERIEAHFDSSRSEIEESNILIDYFDRINKYCNEREIRLIAINTPKVKGYEEMVPSSYKESLKKIIEDMEHKNKDFLYLDYSEIGMETKFMRDADHLNYEGALLFSEMLKQDIETILEGDNYDN